MANHTIDKFTYGGETYILQDNTSEYITASSLPTKTSDLTNDGDGTSAFATLADIGSFGGGTVTSVGVTNATNGGLSISGSPVTTSGTITIGHSNILSSAQTTQAVYPIKFDKNGHISAYGSAVTIPTKTSDLTNDSGFITSYTDTKNTAGSTNTSSKIYLIGATSQAANPQTYSNSNLFFNNGLNSTTTHSEDNIITEIYQTYSTVGLGVTDDETFGHGIEVNATEVRLSATNSATGYVAVNDSGTVITGLITPTANTDAANKKYVDDNKGAQVQIVRW